MLTSISRTRFFLKAERLLDEVSSSISNKYRPTDERLIKLNSDAEVLREALAEAVANNDMKKAEELNRALDENFENFKKIGEETYPTIDVTEEDILESLGEILGVQMSRLDEDKAKFLRDMPDELKKYVIGQDNAVDTIVKNIRRNQLGLRKTSHSAGNFMFIGSTGVGKTFLAKQLAKYLYGSEENLFLRAFLMISSFFSFLFSSIWLEKPRGLAILCASLTPILEVKMMRALVASTFLPSEPVTKPSSRSWRRTS